MAVKFFGLLLLCSLPLRHLRLNSGYGLRLHPISHDWKRHGGIDLYAHHDTVFAVLDGITSRCAFDNRLGLYIKVVHAEGLETTYGHLSQWLVLPGDTVITGESIAVTGATGAATGEHLHFAVKYNNTFIDPLKFLTRMVIPTDTINYQHHESKNQ